MASGRDRMHSQNKLMYIGVQHESRGKGASDRLTVMTAVYVVSVSDTPKE
jgi:hypothetical protein